MDEDDNPWKPVARAVPTSPEQFRATSETSKVRTLAAANATRVLLGCFRSGEANDPEVYTAAMIATLAQYPEDIIKAVCDPRTGLPARSKWLPTVSEVRGECDRLQEDDRQADRRAADFELQMQRRRAFEEQKKNYVPIDFEARYGQNYGLNYDPGMEDAAAKARRMEAIQEGNRRVFEAECTAAGMSPKSYVSPALLKTLRRNDAAA